MLAVSCLPMQTRLVDLSTTDLKQHTYKILDMRLWLLKEELKSEAEYRDE
jgi:hypothetical protein